MLLDNKESKSMISETRDLLKNFSIFKGLELWELEVIAEKVQEESFDKQDRIFAEKSLADNVFLVLTGNVSIKINGFVVDTVGPHEIFGWSAVTDPGTFTAAAFAEEDTSALTIPGKKLNEIFKINNHIGFLVMKNIASLVIARRVNALRKQFQMTRT